MSTSPSEESRERPYPTVESSASFPEIEERILDFWDTDGTFRASIDRREGAPEYVFYDGPPFANGLPHYGHMLTGFVKDVIPRYQTMQGKKVDRRFGWDCHGLPAEMAAEKELGISGHVAINEYGIENFNDYCRTSVLRYTKEWGFYVRRQARWVDFENDYKTMDPPYMESVMWAFKQLYDKGLMYEGYRVLPYCWECETPLSNFETRLDDAYRDRQDQAVTVMFELDPVDGDAAPLKILAWTTTPWTLPSNLLIAVGPDIEYAVMEEDGIHYILAEALLEKYESQLRNATRVGTVGGTELIGRSYKPLFPFLSDKENAFRVVGADFVTTDDGTGVVHIAPYGEDDQKTLESNDISLVDVVDQAGKFTSQVPPYAGLQVFEANSPIIKDLKASGQLVKQESYIHSYPHCWRTDTPLIYKPMSSWFVSVTAIKDRALELNKQINWVPENVRDGAFGSWMSNARDWSISRNRFWGSPIPVWKSDDPKYPRIDVYGSMDELERDFGVRPKDLHRPYIDELTRPNPDDPTGKSTMRRVEDVLDCWFESGSMPYAQVHYPFDNKEWFDNHFPADFIVEYVGQTRAWFYNLHVLGTALFDRQPFSNCIAHGVLLGNDGKKMSKKDKNYPDPDEVFKQQGADALRWFLMSSSVLRGLDLVTETKAITDAVRQVLNPIWNAYYFFTLYANTDGITAKRRTDATGVLDRYILAKTHRLISDVSAQMDTYDISGACASVAAFIDALNNWYIRRSRDRFWKSETDQDKIDAYDTLYTVLTTLCQVSAPLLPMLTEEVYKGLTKDRSVHLLDWPDATEFPLDADLIRTMDAVRDVCSAALSIRKAQNVRVRLPLPTLTVAMSSADDLLPFVDIIADEVNVKDVRLTPAVNDFGTFILQLNAGVLGPRLGPDTQAVMKAAREGDYKMPDTETIEIAGHTLTRDEFSMRLQAEDEQNSRALTAAEGLIVLDTQTTPELEAEGLARDIVRLVQVARREADLHISDRIRLGLQVPSEVGAAITTHPDYVAEQTLAVEIKVDEPLDDLTTSEAELNGEKITIGLAKA